MKITAAQVVKAAKRLEALNEGHGPRLEFSIGSVDLEEIRVSWDYTENKRDAKYCLTAFAEELSKVCYG